MDNEVLFYFWTGMGQWSVYFQHIENKHGFNTMTLSTSSHSCQGVVTTLFINKFVTGSPIKSNVIPLISHLLRHVGL